MMLDVFKGDAFSLTELTTAVNKIPFAPTRIGRMGLFNQRGVSTLTVAIEMKNGVLSLVETKARGSRGGAKNVEKRTIRDFRTVHLPQTVAVMADEVQGIRVFGQQSETQTAMALLMDKMTVARQDLDVTHEYQRIGALKGVVLDADGSTEIVDYLDAFGVSQTTVDFALDADSTKVRGKCNAVHRAIEQALGGVMMTGVHCFVDSTFFDGLIDHPLVRDTYLGTSAAGDLRRSARMTFDYGDIVFEEYRGSVGGNAFMEAGTGYAFPLGVPRLFESYFAPADYMETVNTIGVPFYVSQPEFLPFGKGVEYELQSNPLHICTRPEAVVKVTLT